MTAQERVLVTIEKMINEIENEALSHKAQSR